MHLKRLLGHVAICVQDINKAVRFYQNLGMELAWQDKDWAYLKAGQDGLALLSPEYEQARAHFGFAIGDRTEYLTEFRSAPQLSGVLRHICGQNPRALLQLLFIVKILITIRLSFSMSHPMQWLAVSS